MRALVVFCGGDHITNHHPLAFLLKKGFEHVFVVIADDPYWIRIDAQNGAPKITVEAGTDYDLARDYLYHGATAVIETTYRHKPPAGPFILSNCVGMVKTVLGVRSLSFTPYQLYKELVGHDV